MDEKEFKAVTKEEITRVVTIVDKLAKLLINPANKVVEKCVHTASHSAPARCRAN
jgi:hypothetical protein